VGRDRNLRKPSRVSYNTLAVIVKRHTEGFDILNTTPSHVLYHFVGGCWLTQLSYQSWILQLQICPVQVKKSVLVNYRTFIVSTIVGWIECVIVVLIKFCPLCPNQVCTSFIFPINAPIKKKSTVPQDLLREGLSPHKPSALARAIACFSKPRKLLIASLNPKSFLARVPWSDD